MSHAPKKRFGTLPKHDMTHMTSQQPHSHTKDAYPQNRLALAEIWANSFHHSECSVMCKEYIHAIRSFSDLSHAPKKGFGTLLKHGMTPMTSQQPHSHTKDAYQPGWLWLRYEQIRSTILNAVWCRRSTYMPSEASLTWPMHLRKGLEHS